MDADDMKYVYAAWKLGETPLDAIIAESPEEFTAQFGEHIALRYGHAFTMLAAPPGRDFMPVGVVFGITPFFGKPVMWLGDFIWFPWASKRNKIETGVHLFNQMRKEVTVFGFAEPESISYFEHICRYGVMRRAGTVFDMTQDGPMAIFQTRKPYVGG